MLEATSSRYARRRNSHVRIHIYALFKGFMDRVAALAALLLLLPLLLLVALLVRWRLGSPVFRQQRPGYRCRPFWLLKFRTMTNTRVAGGPLLLMLSGSPLSVACCVSPRLMSFLRCSISCVAR